MTNSERGKWDAKKWDAIVIGSGIGGLTVGALLARYGQRILVCESHGIPGGAAHAFSRNGFQFDSGPSFYCGLGDPNSLNPLRLVLAALGESVEAIAYDPLGHYHFPDGTFPVYGQGERYRRAIAQITPQGAEEFAAFEHRMLGLYGALRDFPLLTLRADWQLFPLFLRHAPGALLKLLPHLGRVQQSVGSVLDETVGDPWVRRLVDLECFLLSGLKAHSTVAPEVAFMLGERTHSVIDYPVGGSGAIVDGLVRGLERWGGVLRLGAHVDRVLLSHGHVSGVRLRNGEDLLAPVVISNATVWDTYTQLLTPEDLPKGFRQDALATPAVDSFMHLHLGIRSGGLEGLNGHHVVVHSADADITTPGNTCMISIPSVWDASLAPPGHHVVHAYTLEPYAGWRRDHTYVEKKNQKSQSLWRALERIIPDVGDRTVVKQVGTPLTHAHFLRRYQGTYGPAIAAGHGQFPGPQTPIPGLYRVGDSTMPGIGVPAVVASGILCANTLVSPQKSLELLAHHQKSDL